MLQVYIKFKIGRRDRNKRKETSGQLETAIIHQPALVTNSLNICSQIDLQLKHSLEQDLIPSFTDLFCYFISAKVGINKML